MKILITGSSGFLGRCVVQTLSRQHRVRGFDLADGDDILCRQSLSSALDGMDVCVHAAAMADLNICERRPEQCERVNVAGAQQVAEQCAALGVRLLFISTACAYGNNGWRVQTEEAPLCPTEKYAESKVRAERQLEVVAGLQHLTLRPATFYGSGMREELAVKVFLNAIAAGRSIQVHGDGRQTRSYVHVDDVVAAIAVLIHQWPSQQRVFNCAGKQSISVLELARICMEETGCCSPMEHIGERTGQIRRSDIDTSALEALGWRPQFCIRQGLRTLLHASAFGPEAVLHRAFAV